MRILPTLSIVVMHLLLFICCAEQRSLTAQIQVSPTRVIVSTRDHSQQIDVVNPTTKPVEVRMDLDFKLIRSDSVGRITLHAPDTDIERARSCKEWLRVFPRRFVLAPGRSRTVRILASAPDSIDEGEYWGRLIFRSASISSAQNADDTADVIRTNLSVALDLDIPVIVRKGSMQTSLEFDNVIAQATAVGTRVLLDMRRTGNCAYRGTLFARLVSEDGTQIKYCEEQFTNEFSLRKALTFPKLLPGNYALSIVSKTVKKGSANDAVVQAEPRFGHYILHVQSTSILVSQAN